MAMAQREKDTRRSAASLEITEWRRAYTPLPDFDAAAGLAVPSLPPLPDAAELKGFWGEVRAALRTSAFAGALAGSLALGLGLMWWAAGGERSFDRVFGLSWCGYFRAHPEAISRWLPKGRPDPDRVIAARRDICGGCAD